MLVYFTISLAVLLGCCGMAIDVGRMELRTTQLQAAADDGALTAAAETQRGNAATYNTLVQNEVSAFLTQANLPAATATGQYNAATGPYNPDYSAMQVTVTQTLPLYFMALVGQTSRVLTARAVAMVPPCAFFRGPSVAPYPTVHLASTQFRAACPVYINDSILNDYFSAEGNSQLKVTGAAALSASSTGGDNHPPIFNAPVLADPLAYLVAPTFSACAYTNKIYPMTTTIPPGTYCGGISVTGGTVTMSPGLYIVTGGISVTNGANLTGSGVTIYLTKGGGSSFGTLSINSATLSVSAPTVSSGGTLAGILIFCDRAWTGTANDLIFNNGAVFQGDGIFYATKTGLSVQGSTMDSGGHYFGIDVTGLYEYLSHIDPSCDYSPLPGGNPFHIPVSLLQ